MILERVPVVAILRSTLVLPLFQSLFGLCCMLLFLHCPFSHAQYWHFQRTRLQQAVDLALDGPAGAIVAIEVESREILASKNLEFAGNELIRRGPTLKPFVLMELLDLGKLDLRQRLLCRRPLRIGGLWLDCSHTPAVSQLDADDAVTYSCSCNVAATSLRMNGSEGVQALRRAGLDSLTGPVKSESAGHVDRPATQGQVQLTALGERGIAVTPRERLAAYRRLALKKHARNAAPYEPICEGLEHAVAYGTAHAATVGGMKIARNTGTASAATSPRTRGIFVGHAPAHQPEIAMVVYISRGRGLDAAMVGHTVFQEYRQLKQKP